MSIRVSFVAALKHVVMHVVSEALKRRSADAHADRDGPRPALSDRGATAAEASPPDLRQCETGLSAPFERRSADAERRANPGVTAGETA